MAPSTYYAAKSRKLSARAERDAVLAPVVRQLWEDNYRVYGARKLWKAARRAASHNLRAPYTLKLASHRLTRTGSITASRRARADNGRARAE